MNKEELESIVTYFKEFLCCEGGTNNSKHCKYQDCDRCWDDKIKEVLNKKLMK